MTAQAPTDRSATGGGQALDRAATANVLGALALVIADRTTALVDDASGHTGAAAPALSALEHILDRPSLDQLGAVLALTPSGTVRLVDRLAAAALVERGPGQDGRTRAISLTPAGEKAANQVTDARAGYLQRLLAGLTDREQRTLHILLGKIIVAVVAEKEGGAWICRLCDLGACGRADGRCPTAAAASVKYGTEPPGASSPL